MILQHAPLRLVQPSDYDQVVTDLHPQQRLCKSRFDLEPRVWRTFRSLPRRIFPAFDIERSSTRREELLLGPDITPRVWLLRRMFGQMIAGPPNGAGMDLTNATEAVLDQLRQTDDNMEFLETLGKNVK